VQESTVNFDERTFETPIEQYTNEGTLNDTRDQLFHKKELPRTQRFPPKHMASDRVHIWESEVNDLYPEREAEDAFNRALRTS